MSVNGIGTTRRPIWRETGKAQRNNSGTGFAGWKAGAHIEYKNGNDCCHADMGEKFSVYDAYAVMGGQGSKFNADNLNAEAMRPVEKAESDRYFIQFSNEISGYGCIYDKRLGKSFHFDPDNITKQTDGNTGKNYIVAVDPNGGLMDVMSADNELMGVLAQFLNVENADSIPASLLNDKYTIEVNEFTGIECLKIKGDESGGAWLLINDERQMEKLKELADMYKEKYPKLIKSDGVAMGFAQAEIAGQAVRTENGIMMIACNGIKYMDHVNPSRSWAVLYPIGATHMYTEIMNAMVEGIDVEEYSEWEKYFEEKGIAYEKILSDEELEVMGERFFRNEFHTSYLF